MILNFYLRYIVWGYGYNNMSEIGQGPWMKKILVWLQVEKEEGDEGPDGNFMGSRRRVLRGEMENPVGSVDGSGDRSQCGMLTESWW